MKKMESLPPEVWLIVLTYLPLNVLIEASAAWKLFFILSRKISFFNEKLSHSRLMFNNSRFIFGCYENACLSFYEQLRLRLEKYVMGEDYFMNVKEIIMNKLLLSVLPFCVWNHMFLCEKDQYSIDMCNFCTKSFISNMKISDHINKTLFVQIEKFPSSLRKGIIMTDKIQMFAHIIVFIDKEDPFKRVSNFVL